MKKTILSTLFALLALCSCTTVNDVEVPNLMVRIDLGNPGYWSTYGVSGFGDYRYFIKETGVPNNFPYTALTYTGFGGVMIICGFDFTTTDYNAVLAYDLSCPVEARKDIRVAIDKTTNEAVCPTCGSHFNVVEGSGAPVSGKALQENLGLRRYRSVAQNGGYIILNQ